MGSNRNAVAPEEEGRKREKRGKKERKGKRKEEKLYHPILSIIKHHRLADLCTALLFLLFLPPPVSFQPSLVLIVLGIMSPAAFIGVHHEGKGRRRRRRTLDKFQSNAPWVLTPLV